jgi:hypothetical protein
MSFSIEDIMFTQIKNTPIKMGGFELLGSDEVMVLDDKTSVQGPGTLQVWCWSTTGKIVAQIVRPNGTHEKVTH